MGSKLSFLFCSRGSSYQDTGRFSKLPYLGIKPAHRPKFQKLHIHHPSNSGGRNLCLFSLYAQRFPKYAPIFKIAKFGHETWPLAKVKEVAVILSFYPRGRIWAYFRPTGSGFRDTAQFFKIAIFGHKTWLLAKVPEVAHVHSFYSRGVEIELILALRAAFSEIWVDFQNCHIWAWNLVKVPEVAHLLPKLPPSSKFNPVLLYARLFKKYTEWPKLSSVSLYDEPFLSYGAIFGKEHRMTPNDLNMFNVKNTNMHATYTPEDQIFVPFALRWAVFELQPNIRKSAPNDPKWPWHVQGKKYQNACYIQPWGPNFRPFRSTISRFELWANFRKSAPNDPK